MCNECIHSNVTHTHWLWIKHVYTDGSAPEWLVHLDQLTKSKKTNEAKIPYHNHAKPSRKSKKPKKIGVCRWEARFATSGGAYRRIQMWAYPLRNAEKTNKTKIPHDNHAKPLRKNKKNKKTKYLGVCRWEPIFGTSAWDFGFFALVMMSVQQGGRGASI